MDQKQFIELAKSFGRFLFFGLLALVSTFLVNVLSSGALTDVTLVLFSQSINLGFVIVAIVGFVIKAIDRYVYLNKDLASNGIALPFLQK